MSGIAASHPGKGLLCGADQSAMDAAGATAARAGAFRCITTAVIAATRPTASTMWMLTSTIGRPVRACQSPTAICTSSTARSSPVHRRSRSAGAMRHEPATSTRVSAERDVRGPGVHVLHQLGVEPVARCAPVAGVRSGAGHEDADHHRDEHGNAVVTCVTAAYQRGTAARAGRASAYTRTTSTAASATSATEAK